ncbi:hypothetical protein [Lentilactobacillus sp. Marseille-Q4993]|uniref:hypothetical protein n=1 Tax=Lentilactobacillus sp. Marseille-Q4993 TaxID=3039492 RepID=UPI0024BC568E|nr:hypothetical protein [Lentilactobacillus sp. Marseille-Q4993]
MIRLAYQLIKPLWEKKILTERNSHTKQSLELGLKFADAIVPEMAILESLSKSDRKKEAIRFVNNQLKSNGLDIDISAVSGLVEQAYQAYKIKGGDNHAPKSTSMPENVPVDTIETNATNAEKSDADVQ